MDIQEALSGGDRRTVGRIKEVVAHILAHPDALPDLVAALDAEEAVVRMRAADALEKVSAQHADWVAPFAEDILAVATRRVDQEIRWHAAQTLPRLGLDPGQRNRAVALFTDCLNAESRILRAFALTGLVEFALTDPALRARVEPLVEEALTSDVPSYAARARKLRKRLDRAS